MTNQLPPSRMAAPLTHSTGIKIGIRAPFVVTVNKFGDAGGRFAECSIAGKLSVREGNKKRGPPGESGPLSVQDDRARSGQGHEAQSKQITR